jgi:hypothetical protein
MLQRYLGDEQYNNKKMKVKRVGLVSVPGNNKTSRDYFEHPQVDFLEIESAYNTDGYIRQALDKYINLIFKEGYDIISKNQKAADYIKARFKLMALAAKTTPDTLFVEIASNLVKYTNVFILKARQDVKFPGLRLREIGNGKPVAGYFVQDVSSVTISRAPNGEVLRYKVWVPGAEKELIFEPKDVIHITYDKESGEAFAVPFVWCVLDDVQLLRQIEETAARMVQKETFPLRTVAIGDTEDGQEASDEEIEAMAGKINNTPEDGWLIHSARAKPDVLGSKREALDAEPYLRYYEQRVFSGLGVSEVLMGRGEGASRSTADNMTDQMYDRILGLQRVMASNIIYHMFIELLLEGGFDPVNKEEDMVYFEFRPLDQNQRIKKENHELVKYQGNLITIEEARRAIGMEPLTDDSRLYVNIVTKPIELIKRGFYDEDPTTEDEKESFVKMDYIKDCADYFNKVYDFFKYDALSVVNCTSNNKESIRKLNVSSSISIECIYKSIVGKLWNSLFYGVEDAKVDINSSDQVDIPYKNALTEIEKSLLADIKHLFSDTVSLISAELGDNFNTSRIFDIFDSNRYRIPLILRSNFIKAYNYGVAVCAKSYNRSVVIASANCNCCKNKYPTSISLEDESYELIPPNDLHCNCKVKVI